MEGFDAEQPSLEACGFPRCELTLPARLTAYRRSSSAYQKAVHKSFDAKAVNARLEGTPCQD